MRRRLFILIAPLVVLLLILGPLRDPILRIPFVQRTIFRYGFQAGVAAARVRRDMVAALELRVVLCGTASPMPSPTRAGPCALVIAANHMWLIDTGGGSIRNLMLWRLPLDRLAGVLLTHFHSDHIEDLGEANMQSWVAGRSAPLAVYGGPGVARVVQGFDDAYAQDSDYRVAHHGKALLPPDAGVMVSHEVGSAPGVPLREGETTPVLAQDGLKITAIGVNHFPVVPAYGYRFDYGGRSVVISGDTRKSPPLAIAARGADVLVHEAQQSELLQQAHTLAAADGLPRLAKIFNDVQSYHTTPDQAGEIANAAGARLLILTHLTPPLPAFFAGPAFLGMAARTRAGGTLLGYDGLMVSLPTGSTAINVTRLN